jgi:hypothetical protein
MTSANVTEYTIRDLSGKEVGTHSQHCYCKTKWGRLLKFTPAENFTITAWGYDEEEEPWADEPVNLKDFIDRLIKNSAQFNTAV